MATPNVGVKTTFKGKGMRLHTQTNQLEEDVCGQREMEILGGELPLKESDDVVSGNAQRLTFHLAELLVCKYIERFSHF